MLVMSVCSDELELELKDSLSKTSEIKYEVKSIITELAPFPKELMVAELSAA